MTELDSMKRVNPGGEPAFWIFHDTVGDEGVCGLAVARAGQPPETATLVVSLQAYTQKTMYRIFAEHGQPYEPATSLLVLGALRPGDIALDVGAHVGYFATLFRLAVGPTGTVFAFEPMPDTYRRLLRNVMINRFTNVLPLPLALADRSGTAEFHIDPDNEGESSLVGAGAETCPVQVGCLDDLFLDGLPARPRVMKLDAEGVELAILNGGRRWFERQAPDMVICEINQGALSRNGVGERDIREYFEARGYRCAVIRVSTPDSGLDLGGGRFYRYFAPGELVGSRCPYVFNLMCVRAGSGLYPDDLL